MGRPGEALASRFKRVLHELEARRKAEEAERAKRLEEGRAARRQLLDDLGAFAESVGHLKVQAQSHDEGITIRYRDRFLHFVPIGEGERLKVTFTGSEGEEHRVYREPELKNRWVWAGHRGGQDERLPLFDAGLEELLVRGLDLPRPSEVEDLAPADTSTLEDVIPNERKL